MPNMYDNDSNIDDTIDDDLARRRNNPDNGPIRNHVRKQAENKVKEISEKTVKKAKRTLFRPVGLTIFSSIFAVFIVLFMIIGIASFIITMPGLVQENIMKSVLGVVNKLSYSINGTDYYLVTLAEDGDRLAQKKVLKYLDDMGLDPAGFGFAAFYENSVKNAETKTEDMPEEDAEWTDDQIKEYIEYDPVNDIQAEMDEDGGLIQAIAYQHDLAKETAQNDLIFKYIISNERTYLIDDKDKDWSDKFTKWIGADFSGMIRTGISGIDDSKITVDRENQTMVISSTNGVLEKDTAYYDLSSYAGRYGMPLEFLLALHIATMSPDLTDEMITNKNLRTKVEMTLEKSNYAADYEIKYKGKELPLKLGNVDDMEDLNKYGEKYFTKNSDGSYTFNLPENKVEKVKKKLNIYSLRGWLYFIQSFDFSQWTAAAEFYEITNLAKNALLSDATFRVNYHIASTYYRETAADWSVYLGEATEGSADIPEEILEILSTNSNESSNNFSFTKVNNGNSTSYYDSNHADQDANSPVYHTYASNSSANYDEIFANLKEAASGLSEISLRYDYTYAPEDAILETGIMHGIDYYLDTEHPEHLQELKEKAQYNGMTCVLSQLDAYMYANGLTDTEEYKAQNNKYSKLAASLTDNGYAKNEEVDAGFAFPLGIRNPTDSSNEVKSYQLLLTREWVNFLNSTNNLTTCTDQELKNELNNLKTEIDNFYNAIDNADNHMDTEQAEAAMHELFKAVGYSDLDTLTINDVVTIYDVLVNITTDEFEFALPRIKNVLRHWYKDIIYEDAISGINVYSKSDESIRYPLETGNSDLEVTAVLSGGESYTQAGQPYVVKGDVVTLDGEVVTDKNLSSRTYEISNGRGGKDQYTLGDGYRTTKKLFTQGYYYTFDGSHETSKSIYYAKMLEELGNNTAGSLAQTYAKVHVKNGRISIANTFNKNKMDNFDNPEQSPYAEFYSAYDTKNKKWNVTENVVTGDGWSTYKAKTVNGVDIYYVVADGNTSLNYLSVGDSYVSAEDCKKSAQRINNMLMSMGVVTIRKPLSFDNTSQEGDVMSLTAFSILEGMHTESAEYIYRDLKEMLIDLGYYTKAEFEAIDTNVLTWFIPDYRPVENTTDGVKHWRQNKGSDALKFGAIIYPLGYEVEDDISSTSNNSTEAENKDNEESAIEGFEPDLDVVAPGNCKILEAQGDKITLEFDGLSEPEIGILDGYTMVIKGIKLNEEAITVVDSDGNESEHSLADILNSNGTYIVKAGATIGYTADSPIQTIMKNNLGGYVENIDDYMSPEITSGGANGNYLGNDDAVLYYWTQYESGDNATIVNALSSNEVACGIAQWTTTATLSNVQGICAKLYSMDPSFCSSLNAFSSWSNQDVMTDINGSNSQIRAAFKAIGEKDYQKFKLMQYQAVIEQRTENIHNLGMDYILDKKVAFASLVSLTNWRPGYAWNQQIDASMSEEEMVIRLFKYAWDVSSEDSTYVTAWRNRWNCQAKLAVDIINGKYTDIEAWTNGEASAEAVSKYKGVDDGWLNSQFKTY